MRRSKLTRGIEVDERTRTMPDVALECRDMQHAWLRIPSPRKIVEQMFAKGYVESKRRCNRCGTVRVDTYDARSFGLVSRAYSERPEGYLVGGDYKGTGRLPIEAARAAQFVRDLDVADD